MKYTLLTIVISLLIQSHTYGQEVKIDSVIYKKKDTVSLIMKVIYPPSMDRNKKYPAMVFYSGGNWDYGNLGHFKRQANYFAKRGMVCFLAEYGNKIRTKEIKESNLHTSISDAKSCIRYIRENANRFNVDVNKIIAAGGSAGGHLAAAIATIDEYDDLKDNMAISAKPNGLVLFNPVIDFGPTGDVEMYETLGEKYRQTSPAHHVKQGMPPTLILHGSEDKYNSPEAMMAYKESMEAAGGRCDLVIYDDQEHGFFNYGRSVKYYKETVLEVDRFLISLGHISGEPTIMIE